LVNVIAQTVAPEQVILFGSQARGTARPDSDYDFLVVMRDVENERHVSRRIYRALFEQQVGVAVDVVVVNAEKLARHCETPGFVYKQALQEGEVCYDRTSSI
jgi:predicted nucleotidyltransferase